MRTWNFYTAKELHPDTGDSPAVSCPSDTTQGTVPGVMACMPDGNAPAARWDGAFSGRRARKYSRAARNSRHSI